jgi:hypothetical protein
LSLEIAKTCRAANRELLEDSIRYFDDALDVDEECKLLVFGTRNTFVPYVDLISVLNCSQREGRHSLEHVTRVDKVVVRSCIEILVREKVVLYVFISKINKRKGVGIFSTTL